MLRAALGSGGASVFGLMRRRGRDIDRELTEDCSVFRGDAVDTWLGECSVADQALFVHNESLIFDGDSLSSKSLADVKGHDLIIVCCVGWLGTRVVQAYPHICCKMRVCLCVWLQHL